MNVNSEVDLKRDRARSKQQKSTSRIRTHLNQLMKNSNIVLQKILDKSSAQFEEGIQIVPERHQPADGGIYGMTGTFERDGSTRRSAHSSLEKSPYQIPCHDLLPRQEVDR